LHSFEKEKENFGGFFQKEAKKSQKDLNTTLFSNITTPKR
jgi:hypothetical protein